MNDCPNAEIRDLLPDLMHGRLDASTRAVVTAHVGECADCRAELDLLRGLHETLVARTPRVDVAWVVSALPKSPAASRTTRVGAPRRSWSDWRIAAAVTLLIAGGSSVAVYNTLGTARTVHVAVADSDARIENPMMNTVQPGQSPATVASLTQNPTSAETVAMAEVQSESNFDIADPIGSLNDSELEELLNEIDRLEAVPITDPDPVSLRIGGRAGDVNELETGSTTSRRGGA